jgi:heterodisulfide reductase subunit A2
VSNFAFMRDIEMDNVVSLKENVEQLRKSLEGDNNFGDVMVVGGGISGIQASLDLATAGFKVYLVDKSPTIGGHMAQLDKTFPTNDCSI